MKIYDLYDLFKENVVYHSLPVPFCNLEKGIKMILPTFGEEEDGTVLIGDIENFRLLEYKNKLSTNCTYIVCLNDTDFAEPCYNASINIIFLDTSLHRALDTISKIYMQKVNGNDTDNTALYHDFWNDILYCRISSQKQVLSRISEFPYKLKRHIALIVVRNQTDLSTSKSEYKTVSNTVYKKHEITRELESFFTDTNLFYTGEEWIVIYSQDKDTSDYLDIDYELFSALLARYSLNAGISYACQLPELLRTLYFTASAALDLGLGMDIKPEISHIYTFHQYNMYYVIHMCAHAYEMVHKTDNLIYLTHPDITRLYYYDQEKRNNLLEVLFEYLKSGQNAGSTARSLYMHRNTVINKLSKIEEVLGHKLDYEKDHFLLLESCMIMNYQHNFARHNISRYFDMHDFA
ncbi:PucR family transcriptional regulator [Butyrivibrio fibrisolvens]|uniref:PucR family transcriptional regulator n=1 Tax=Butyrivibrio fibrisolvens TaxID=831 RepID=UPI0004095A58|nr:helix-turn-helix domain-containing protein [Butyrivibrio fibrisolvens]